MSLDDAGGGRRCPMPQAGPYSDQHRRLLWTGTSAASLITGHDDAERHSVARLRGPYLARSQRRLLHLRQRNRFPGVARAGSTWPLCPHAPHQTMRI